MIQLYDRWVDAADKGKFSGVTLLDMSAAFDVVDHSLLLQKLQLYGMNENSIKWMESYLSGTSQCVAIDGCLSPFLPVDCGVPQGSILGPLMYVLFTNELPDVIHEEHRHHDGQDQHHAPFQTDCPECGTLCCYADDGTYTLSSNKDERKILIDIQFYGEQQIEAEHRQNPFHADNNC